MPSAICNTSPLLYLFRINSIEWLPQLFDEVWTTSVSAKELKEGKNRGYDVPVVENFEWLKIKDPKTIPSEWYSVDLGMGELHTLALGFENRDFILLLDDLLARKTAQTAGLTVWGTLRILIRAKEEKVIKEIKPYVYRLKDSGLWVSDEVLNRILRLADESD